ncbi:MAG: histidine phosphatase family protein [Anaerolineales bacterium]|nr:histidine phosphatase family protein [Anaerolineales bacterium]
MPLLLLIRHGENEYVKTGKLAGRLPGVHLNERGRQQAAELAEALKSAPLKALYSSPLERAVETAEPIAAGRKLEVQLRSELMDNDIGKWQGRSLKVLRRMKKWKIVQQAPSRFTFPEGESFLETQTRIVSCLDEIAASHKLKDIVALVFHADPIKLAVAHYLGMPLDHFQRLGCDTGSVTALYLAETGAHLIKLNQRPPFDFLPKTDEKKK